MDDTRISLFSARLPARFWAAGALAVAMTAALAAPVQAADLSASSATPVAAAPEGVDGLGGWNFQLNLYGWATALDGDVGLRNLPTASVHMPFSQVLKKLDGALMGSLFARNGNWLVLADLVYARMSTHADTGLLGGSALDVGLKQTILSGAVGYILPHTPDDLDVAFTAGARYVSLKGSMSIDPFAAPVTLSATQRQSWVDPTVGVFAHWKVNDSWFVNVIADIGGFGAGSQLSSTGYAGVGYMWTQGFSTSLGYRYLYEDYEGPGARVGTFRYRTLMHGPTMALAFHF